MQLLISVRNADEAALALAAGADIIDLKDPDSGALGALNAGDTRQVLQMVNGRVPVSATVGEDHPTLEALLDPIRLRIALGVDIIKVSVSGLFYQNDFMSEISSLACGQAKFVAIFFADSEPDFGLLPRLHQAGFWGAMLDTRNKHKNLLQNRTSGYLQHFITPVSYTHLDVYKRQRYSSGAWSGRLERFAAVFRARWQSSGFEPV